MTVVIVGTSIVDTDPLNKSIDVCYVERCNNHRNYYKAAGQVHKSAKTTT